MKKIFIISILLSLSNAIAQTNSSNIIFSTDMLKSTKKLVINKTETFLSVKKKCNEIGEPPFECFTNISFLKDIYPGIKVKGEAYAFASYDINQDGNDEFIVLSENGGGNWRTVNIFCLADPTMTSGPYWYEPFQSFSWFPGFDGDNNCNAKITWISAKNEVNILTTNAGDENFKCNELIVNKWVIK